MFGSGWRLGGTEYERHHRLGDELKRLRQTLPDGDRDPDILKLAQHFLAKWARVDGKDALNLSPSAAQKLMAYDWPGNVRELENSMERAVALARFDQLTVDDLPEKIRKHSVDPFVIAANDAMEIVSIEEIGRRHILRVVSLVGGNRSRAAQALGIDRRTLYRRLESYESAPGAKS